MSAALAASISASLTASADPLWSIASMHSLQARSNAGPCCLALGQRSRSARAAVHDVVDLAITAGRVKAKLDGFDLGIGH